MAAPGNFPLNLYQGDTSIYSLTLTRTNSAGVKTPVDLTAAVGMAQIRRRPGDTGTPMATFTVTFPDPLNGKVLLTLPPSQSMRTVTNGAWDLQIIESNGRAKTWLAGTVTIKPRVSRRTSDGST